MNWNNHSALEGCHAYLGASKYHWINYDKKKLIDAYVNFKATQRGTELHEFASHCIKLKQRLPDEPVTLNMFVNDAINLSMSSEVILYYSENFFGTADAISFKDNMLRIHDLKTGSTTTHMEQLEIYAALFCLEYRIKPKDIQMELRIYQNDQAVIFTPDPEEIEAIMDKGKEFDSLIKKVNKGELWQ